MKKVLIAGGLCGTTMLRIEQDIKKESLDKGFNVNIKIQNLWETTFVDSNYDLIIEMFPFFDKTKYNILNGRAYILHKGERELIDKVTELLK